MQVGNSLMLLRRTTPLKVARLLRVKQPVSNLCQYTLYILGEVYGENTIDLPWFKKIIS